MFQGIQSDSKFHLNSFLGGRRRESDQTDFVAVNEHSNALFNLYKKLVGWQCGTTSEEVQVHRV